jgi:hypothetical protein
MRFVSFVVALAALVVSGAANAQTWDEYSNRDDFFSVNFPGDPVRTEFAYKTAKGTSLPAHAYTAQDSRGRYTITVVNYSTAKDELASAIDEAVANLRAKGKPTYDAVNMLDNHRSWRITVETPQGRRLLGEVLVAMNDNLYISEAETALNVPPPAQFSVSLQILDADGVRIRYRQVEPAKPGEIVPVTAAARDQEVAVMEKQVAGTWKNAGGSCEAAYFKAGARVKTVRGEEAMAGTVVNNGVTIQGQAIIAGPREGQFINPMTDKVIMIFEPQDGGRKINFSALGPPASGWPDVTLELCPGTRT